MILVTAARFAHHDADHVHLGPEFKGIFGGMYDLYYDPRNHAFVARFAQEAVDATTCLRMPVEVLNLVRHKDSAQWAVRAEEVATDWNLI